MSSETTSRALLRHAVATLAYRAAKTLRDAPEGFGAFDVGGGVRTPSEILDHVANVLDWARRAACGEAPPPSAPAAHVPWEDAVRRFTRSLEDLDARLARPDELAAPSERLLQGPIADALTHIGQLALLRRLAGSPVSGENFFAADIAPGRVGFDHNPPG
jgi:hypothetical protein